MFGPRIDITGRDKAVMIVPTQCSDENSLRCIGGDVIAAIVRDKDVPDQSTATPDGLTILFVMVLDMI